MTTLSEPFKNEAFIRKAKKHLRAADPQMADIVTKVGPFKPGLISNTFEALVRSIIHQQLSMKAAHTICERVFALCRRRLSAASVGRLTSDQLRTAGISRQKMSYLQSISEHFQSGKIKSPQLRRMSDEEVTETLVQIRGVGVWTAEMILIFNLQRPDVWPIDDLGLKTALKKWYKIPMTAKRPRLLRVGEKFRPYRSIATWYLWASLDSGIVPGFE